MVAEAKTLSPADLIAQRLRLQMVQKGISSADLAARADVKTSFLYDIMNGKSTNPSTIKLARVADALGVSLTYLAGHIDSPSPERLFKEMGGDYVIIPRLMIDVSTGGSTVISQEHKQERYQFRRTWIEEQLGISPSEVRMLYVRGDSMEPTLCHNDIVLVDMTKKLPSPPGVFILYDGFGLMAKRLEFAGNDSDPLLRIISDNPQYSTYERPVSETFVIGRVVWFSREV